MPPAYLQGPDIVRTPRHGRRLVQCEGKAQLPNYREAARSSTRLSQRSGGFMEPYRCPICGMWHVGSRAAGGELDIQRRQELIRSEPAAAVAAP
jgi:hypothetical protein